jgi:hypothetical protein
VGTEIGDLDQHAVTRWTRVHCSGETSGAASSALPSRSGPQPASPVQIGVVPFVQPGAATKSPRAQSSRQRASARTSIPKSLGGFRVRDQCGGMSEMGTFTSKHPPEGGGKWPACLNLAAMQAATLGLAKSVVAALAEQRFPFDAMRTLIFTLPCSVESCASASS